MFQALPDRVRLLLPGLQPSGEPAYAFRPLTLKKVAHHPDGLAQGRRRQAEALALRQLERRCGPLDAPTRSRLERLSLEPLETLALDLLDFEGPEDLAHWLASQGDR